MAPALSNVSHPEPHSMHMNGTCHGRTQCRTTRVYPAVTRMRYADEFNKTTVMYGTVSLEQPWRQTSYARWVGACFQRCPRPAHHQGCTLHFCQTSGADVVSCSCNHWTDFLFFRAFTMVCPAFMESLHFLCCAFSVR